MLGFLFRGKPSRGKEKRYDPARVIYAKALEQTRDPDCYTQGGVPDTFDGRFDLLVLHVFMVLNRLLDDGTQEDLSQKLFDSMFRDMDQTLREMGIGDMGIPKHMKKMMKAFNGRVHAYRDALSGPPDERSEKLEACLRRNLYGTLENPDTPAVRTMTSYVLANVQHLKEIDSESLKVGNFAYTKDDIFAESGV